MNFVKAVDKSFVVSKNIIRKKSESESTKRKRAFICSHDFSVNVTPAGKCIMNATKR